ncbi:MAG: hypothetical protein AAGF24_06830 [Cyanobacteria bacterium P01_H01_bin.121]
MNTTEICNTISTEGLKAYADQGTLSAVADALAAVGVDCGLVSDVRVIANYQPDMWCKLAKVAFINRTEEAILSALL